MRGLDPRIHFGPVRRRDVDGRNKCGHDASMEIQTARGSGRGNCYMEGRTEGPERATARRAVRRVSQANGVRARRLREMKKTRARR